MRRPPMSAHLFQKERVLAQEATVVLSCCTCFHFKVYDQIPPHLSSLHVIKPINPNYNVYIDLSLKLTFGMKLLLHRFIVSFGFEKHLYVNSSRNFWVLGNASHTDYIFNISSKTVEFSPLGWDDRWKPTDSSTSVKPVIRPLDPSILPPFNITLTPIVLGQLFLPDTTY